MGYKTELQIDPNNLDVDCMDQAELFAKYGEDYAIACAERDRAKQKLEIIKAEVDADIRANPDSYGFDKKPTETAIANMVVTNTQVCHTTEDFIAATEKANILQVAKMAFQQRNDQLKNMVSLFMSNYYQPTMNNERFERIKKG